MAVGALVGVIALIFGGGLLYDNLVRANAVVAQIGTESITASRLVDEMQPALRGIQAQVKQAGPGANVSQYVDSQKRGLPDQTLNDLIDRRLISQEATRRGLAVAPAELDDKQRQTVADFQSATNPTPTVEPTSTPEGAPATAPTPVPTADLNGTPTALPTLEPTAYAAALQDLLNRNGLTETDLRNRLEENLLRDKVSKAIGEEQVPPVQEQVHARHILVATQDQAKDVLTQLQGGADFAQLAQQLSTDPGSKDKGGDLGWFGRGVMNKPFEDAAFALQPGQLSDVVQSPNGYHVIQLLERDPSRPVPADQLQTQRDKAFSDWLASRRSNPDVKLELNQAERDWVLSRIGVRP